MNPLKSSPGLAAFGLLLIVSAPVTYLVHRVAWVMWCKLALGVPLTVIGLRGVRLRLGYAFTSATFGLGILATLVVVNFGASALRPRDLTREGLNTLSAETRATLAALQDDVEIIAFSSGESPPWDADVIRRFREASSHLTFIKTSVAADATLAMKYGASNETPLVVAQGPQRSHALDVRRLRSPIEAEDEVRRALALVTGPPARSLYFLVGHGEIAPGSPSASPELAPALAALGFGVRSLNFALAHAVPADAAALIIAGPTTAFLDAEVRLLDAYLESGGHLAVFLEPLAVSGLEELLARYGISPEPGVVADGALDLAEPYLVVAPTLADVPLTHAMRARQLNAVFFTARALTLLREGILADVVVKPVALSSPTAFIANPPTAHPRPEPGARTGQLTLVAQAVRARPPSPDAGREARVVVLGDLDILKASFAYDADRALVEGAFQWLAGNQPARAAPLRAPPPSTFQVSETQLRAVRVVALDVLPLALVAAGLLLWQVRRAR